LALRKEYSVLKGNKRTQTTKLKNTPGQTIFDFTFGIFFKLGYKATQPLMKTVNEA